MKFILSLLLVSVLLVAGCIGQESTGTATGSEQPESVPNQPKDNPPTGYVASDFPLVRTQIIQAAGVAGSNPKHSELLGAVPQEIVITTNSQPGSGSDISVAYLGSDVASGEAAISGNSIRRSIQASGDGEYVVSYTLCDASGSCQQGKFAFLVDSNFG